MKGRKIILCVTVILLLIIPLASAGFLDWVKKTITGKASSQETNVSVTVAGGNKAVIETVSVAASYTPVENENHSITAYVTVYDADGVNDVNDSATQIKFTKSGETTRQNTSCINLTDIDANRANFSCVVDLWYWDGNGVWNINATGNDLGNKTLAENSTESFTYNLLYAMVISPNVLTWPSVTPGAVNQTSNNHPTLVNNTGNYNGTINMTGINLLGEDTPSEKIYAENFTAGIVNDCDLTGINMTYLVNNTEVVINNSVANRGNLSLGSGSGQEQIYYCIPLVPNPLSSQTYSTNALGGWTLAYA